MKVFEQIQIFLILAVFSNASKIKAKIHLKKSTHQQKVHIRSHKKQITAEITTSLNDHLNTNNLLDTSNQQNKVLTPINNLLLTNAATVQAQGTVIENGPQKRIGQTIAITQGNDVNALNGRSAYPLRVSSMGGNDGCSCQGGGLANPENIQCPPCVLSKTMRQMHQLASDNAQEDADNQSAMEKESLIEKRLFQAAKQYAQQAGYNEDQARLAGLEMQKYSSWAQIARNKMSRAENEAKQLALQLVNDIVVHPPHESQGIPGMTIQRTGSRTKTVIQQTPYYNLHIGQTSSKGFIDPIQQQLAQNIANPLLQQ